jgi:ribosomal protein S6--L-glutamate ligase
MARMRLCFIIEEEYRDDRMPLRVADRLASWGHDVHLLHPRESATCLSALARDGEDRFDAYVLKTVSDGPGICILEAAAASGVTAINNPRSIRLVRDKAAAAAHARAAQIPFPLTYFIVDVDQAAVIPREHYPLVIKPTNGSSTREVHRIDDPAQLVALQLNPHGRFFLAQRYVENEGYDLKLYCIGREVFAVMRASPLHPDCSVTERQVQVTPELAAIARNVRRVFGLDIFGADVVRATEGWVAVDVNDFPGFGGVPDAVSLISRRIAQLARTAALRRAVSAQGRTLLRGLVGPHAKPDPPARRPAAATPAASQRGDAATGSMKICLLLDRLGHPVLEATARELAQQRGASVAVVDVKREQPPDDADVYLLKSRSEKALMAARRAELQGASVINGVAATAACLDRTSMALRMRRAGLPFPDTWSGPTLEDLIAALSAHHPVWPIIVKSRRSRRGDLVRMISSAAALSELAAEWGPEAVIAQRVVRHDGWEHKVWVIGERISAVRRRPDFAHHKARVADDDAACEPVPAAIESLARAAGAAFGLELYGVDVLVGERGPVVVDVNPFPGFRRVPSAAETLAAHVARLGRRAPVPV